MHIYVYDVCNVYKDVETHLIIYIYIYIYMIYFSKMICENLACGANSYGTWERPVISHIGVLDENAIQMRENSV